MQMRELLGASGPFNKALQGFMPRAGQQDLSEVIHQVLHNRGTLVAEAGTGIGKTFAYLVPAMLADKKKLLFRPAPGICKINYFTAIYLP